MGYMGPKHDTKRVVREREFRHIAAPRGEQARWPACSIAFDPYALGRPRLGLHAPQESQTAVSFFAMALGGNGPMGIYFR